MKMFLLVHASLYTLKTILNFSMTSEESFYGPKVIDTTIKGSFTVKTILD